MKKWLAFLLVLVGILSYFFVSTQLGWYQRYPIVHFALALAGLVLLFRAVRSKFTVSGLLLNLVGWALFLFFVWFSLSFSTYDTVKTRYARGDVLPLSESGLNLLDQDGQAISLAKSFQGHRGNLLVFYRGYW